MSTQRKKVPWGDRFLVYVLIFSLGFITADQIYARQLVSLDQQVKAALAAVGTAHAQIDQLEGCSLRGAAPIVSAALQGNTHE